MGDLDGGHGPGMGNRRGQPGMASQLPVLPQAEVACRDAAIRRDGGGLHHHHPRPADRALQQMRQAECNRLEVAHESVRASIVKLIADLDGEIAQVRKQIQKTIDDDPDLKRRDELLQTVPGLGDKTIPQLLAYIGRPERFKSVKALIAYAKLAPMIKQSGTSLNKHRGTHPMGHTALKQALYFPAMVAGRFNPLVAAFWARLKAQNKPGKLIVEACMHKLLAIAYGVLRSDKPFNANHQKPAGA
jgi:transposase